MANRRQHMNYRAEGFVPVGNEAFEEAMREKARSSAVRPQKSRKYKGTRSAKRREAINSGF